MDVLEHRSLRQNLSPSPDFRGKISGELRRFICFCEIRLLLIMEFHFLSIS